MHSHYRNMAFATRFVRGLKSSNAIQLRQCSQILQHQKLPLVAATRGEALSSESHQDHMKAYGEEHRRFHSAEYERVFKRAIDHPDEFWGEQAEKLTWFRKWDKVLDDSDSPFTQWFVGGEMNTCYNAVDRHVERGFGNQVAIIHDSPVTKKVAMISFRQLQQKVARLAGVLVKHGVQKGDRVLIYMPMIPEAVITMLACARIGAIHSLVFGGFAAREVAVRLNHAKAVVVVSANCGVEPSRIVNYKSIVDEAIEISDHKPDKCIIFNRPEMEDAPLIPGRDLSWEEEMEKARHHDCIPVLATDPIYILYTSGTTGTPKAVVRPSGDHAVVLNWSMEALYGIKPHEVWWANSDLGWVVGHSYICYAPLLAGNTTVIYEGKPVGTPDSGALFRVIHDHDCAAMFIAPTALRAVRREDTEIQIGSRYTLKKLRSLFVAGEHCDHETLDWAKWAFRVPVLDNWWQTETGWAITASCVGLRNSLYPPHGVSGMPVPGYNVKILDKGGNELGPGELGQICVKLPLPPGNLSTLWDNDEKFQDLYFSQYPGYYDTMDAGIVDPNGYISVMSRADDVINVAGHRISGGSLEEAILEHNDLVECAVLGVPDELKGTVPLGLLVLKHGVEESEGYSEEKVVNEVIQVVRGRIGPVAAFKLAVVVPKLPKTRSGKIARSTVVALAESKPFKIPVTIEDASVYPAIRDALQRIGYAQDAVIPEV